MAMGPSAALLRAGTTQWARCASPTDGGHSRWQAAPWKHAEYQRKTDGSGQTSRARVVETKGWR